VSGVSMFGKIIRSLKAGGNGAKAIRVLSRTYHLQVSHPEHIKMIQRITSDYGELLNEHEMAIEFLAQFATTIKIDHPKAQSEVKKYIRMAKGAQKRGLVESSIVMERLFNVANERFGIIPESIEAV
jgi:hypothetical protein